METLDREILSRELYACWQEPCSDIELFLRAGNSPTVWVLSSGDRGRVADKSVMVACYFDSYALIVGTLWDAYDQHPLLPRRVFHGSDWHDVPGWFELVKNLFSAKVHQVTWPYELPPLLQAPAEPAKSRPEVSRFTLEQQWIERNRKEYAGKWVALEGDRLLAFAETAKAVYRAASEIGVQRPLVVKVEPPDQPPFAGW